MAGPCLCHFRKCERSQFDGRVIVEICVNCGKLKRFYIEEFWSNLKLLCENHPEFSYDYIKSKKFPFEYKGWDFRKVEVNRMTNGFQNGVKKGL